MTIDKSQLNSAAEIIAQCGWSDFKMNKIHMCEKTNAIRARFKHDIAGFVGGIVKPDFQIKNEMTLEEIQENVTVDTVHFTLMFNTILEKGWRPRRGGNVNE